MRRCPVFGDESQDMLSTITRKIENLQLKNRKQSSIKEFFFAPIVSVLAGFHCTPNNKFLDPTNKETKKSCGTVVEVHLL